MTPVNDEIAAWARTFLRETLDHWLSAADTPSGLFHPYLDRRWNRRDGGGPRTLVSQCRLVYNFCRGYETFQDTRYADAAARGLAALATHFRGPPGRYRWAVHPDGTEADPTPDAYGHAFCVLAQATAARALADPARAAVALETWEYVSATLTDRHGGLLWRLDRPDAWDHSPRSQNPLMHTVEALMVLHDVDPTGRARAAAQAVLTFLHSLGNFPGGTLVERYAPDWTPLPVAEGGVVDLGHACEWAWLLSEWHRLTRESSALDTGTRFLQTALTRGLDADGGLFESCAPDGPVVGRAKGLWQQCETIRALRRYAVAHGRTDLDTPLRRTLAFYRTHFVDPEYGGVFATINDGDRPADLHKGDAWKLDYHTVGMCLELIGEAAPFPGKLRLTVQR